MGWVIGLLVGILVSNVAIYGVLKELCYALHSKLNKFTYYDDEPEVGQFGGDK